MLTQKEQDLLIRIRSKIKSIKDVIIIKQISVSYQSLDEIDELVI